MVSQLLAIASAIDYYAQNFEGLHFTGYHYNPLDYYPHYYLGGGEVDVWDTTTHRWAWRGIGSVPAFRFYEPGQVLFPANLFSKEDLLAMGF